MAATSTSWGLGTHKMTADISSSTPVASPSTESPIKSRSFGVVEGSNNDSPTMPSPSNGSTTAVAAAGTAVTTNHNTNSSAAANSTSSTPNGVERVPATEGEVGAAAEGDGEASEVAGTSSDSGDDDDDDNEGGRRSTTTGTAGATDGTAAATASTSAGKEEKTEDKVEGDGGAEVKPAQQEQEEEVATAKAEGKRPAIKERPSEDDGGKQGIEEGGKAMELSEEIGGVATCTAEKGGGASKSNEKSAEEPATGESAKGQPGEEEYVQEEPSKEEPAKEENAKDQLVKAELAKEQLVKEESAEEGSAKEAPAGNERAAQESSKAEPAGPAKSKESEQSEEKSAAQTEKNESVQANGHGPVHSASKVGSSGGNNRRTAAAAAVATPLVAARSSTSSSQPSASVSQRQEVDEHAARASDAATAALAAALASAARNPSSPRPGRASPTSKSPAPALQQKPKAEGRDAAAQTAAQTAAAAAVAGAGAGGRGGREGAVGRDPLVMMFGEPQGRELPSKVNEADVEDALTVAGFVPERSSAAWGGVGPLPPPLPLPTTPMPCMVGYFKVDETTGVHRCAGTWAMNKTDLLAAAKNESRASPFEIKVVQGGGGSGDGGALRFPHTGKYQGHFLVRQPPKPVSKVEEKDLNIAFVKNSGGGWNVEGRGRNVYGTFTITGRLDADRRLEVYREYPKLPKANHRRASGSAAASTPARRPAGGGLSATLPPHWPSRGKHPLSAPPPAAMMVDESNSESPAPTSRRVSRTPSYLIKDIGNDTTTHLPHGLRRCVTVLNKLRAVPGKSEWFNDPVDYVGLNLPEYTKIIKRPMDLGTIKHKLEGGEYKNTVEFAHDVRLVFSNACHYNSDPTSAVHLAARDLLLTFEEKLRELGPGLDDPPKRKKLNGGGGSSSSSGSSNHQPYSGSGFAGGYGGSESDGGEVVEHRDRKRKSSGGGSKSGGDGGSSGGGGGGGSASKKARTPAKALPTPKPEPQPSVAAVAAAAPPPPPAPPAVPFVPDPQQQQVLFMQAQITAMQQQLLAMQGGAAAVAAVAAPPVTAVEPPTPKQPSSGSKRKSKAGNSKGACSSKGGAKSARGSGGKKGGGGRAAANPQKAAADKAAKAAAKARKIAEEKKRKAEEAAKAAADLAAQQNPLTFDEKKALSVAINNLDQTNLTRVVEIIQARMPLGSSDEEIELDIDSMDNLTLRDLQGFIKEVSEKGGGFRRGGGGADSDSDGEQW